MGFITLVMAVCMIVSLFMIFKTEALAASAPTIAEMDGVERETSRGDGPPLAPTVSGVEHQGKYKTPVVPDWVDESGTVSSATISKDGGKAVRYLKGTAIGANGSYELIVTAKKVSNGLAASMRIQFAIELELLPEVEFTTTEGYGVYFEPVILGWTPAEGTVISDTVLVNETTGEVFPEFQNHSTVTDNGSYEFSYTVRKTLNGVTSTQRYSSFFLITGIRGVAEGEAYLSATPEWTEFANWGGATETSATLKRNDGPALSFMKGTTIEEEGRYVLTVTWQSLNGIREIQSVNFTVGSPPEPTRINIWGDLRAAPQIYYLAYMNWWNAPGTTIIATLTKDGGASRPYQKGGYVQENGVYELTLTTTKLSNGLTAESKLVFAIENFSPRPPTFSGTDGFEVNLEPLVLGWMPLEGTTVTDTRLVNMITGEIKHDFQNGTMISEDGSYEFYFTVRKTTLGIELKNSYLIQFLITGIRGVSEGERYQSVTPDWVDFDSWGFPNVGTVATLSKDGGPALSYEKGEEISDAGYYTLTVNWNSSNGIRATQSVNFTVAGGL